jgi:hypothetical protein
MQTWFPFIFGCLKNWHIHCKTMFTCWVSLFCNGFPLGPTEEATLVYLWSRLVCLFCFVLYLWDPPNQNASDHILGLFGKLLRRRSDASAWFHGVWTRGAKVLEYWMISSPKLKLNRSWKFQRNWNMPLVLLERSYEHEINGIYLVRFGFRMWEILI